MAVTRPELSRRERLVALVRAFHGLRVLVVGDMVADEYVVGTPTRISREAPVLILGFRERFTVPGGATNPGVNARTLGAEVALCGIVGDDAAGERLRAELEKFGVGMEGLLSEHGRPTSSKTRIVAGDRQVMQQQIVRVDVVSDDDLSERSAATMRAYLERVVPQVDSLIISDYENGVINPGIIATVLMLADEHQRDIVVDSHGDLTRFQGVTALTPNQPEAEAMLGRSFTDRESLERGGHDLLEMTGAQGILITRGAAGMSLFERGQPPLHLAASNTKEVADPTGAGDTVAATFTLALAAHGSMADAAVLANLAAGLVVRRLGCATTTPDELIAAVNAQIVD